MAMDPMMASIRSSARLESEQWSWMYRNSRSGEPDPLHNNTSIKLMASISSEPLTTRTRTLFQKEALKQSRSLSLTVYRRCSGVVHPVIKYNCLVLEADVEPLRAAVDATIPLACLAGSGRVDDGE